MRVAHSVLTRILDDAVKDRMLAANPARGVKLPKQAPPRNVYLTAAQLDTLAIELQDYSQTKSALHFDPKKGLPATLVRKLIKARIAES